jgi:hypothetical protein
MSAPEHLSDPLANGGPARPWTAKDEAVLQLLDIAYFALVRCRFRCDERQRELLSRESRQVVLNCSRQSGKSTLVALKILHRVFWTPNATVVVTAPVLQQTAELLHKVREFGRVAGVLHAKRGRKYCVELANGSRIVGVAANESTIRGFSSVALLVVDEAARVEDEVFEAAEPMLAVSRGSLWILSTPKGRRGYFYRAVTSSDWVKMRVTAAECGRIPQEFLKKQLRKMGERLFAQEYECQFVELDHGVFDAEAVDGAFERKVTALPELQL